MKIVGKFTITNWQEEIVEQLAGESKYSCAQVEQSYSGDICASSQVTWQLLYTNSNNACFNGFERIQAKREEGGQRSWLVVLKHQGKFQSGIASSQFEVVYSSYDNLKVGQTGSFNATTGGQADYQFN